MEQIELHTDTPFLVTIIREDDKRYFLDSYKTLLAARRATIKHLKGQPESWGFIKNTLTGESFSPRKNGKGWR